MIGQRNLLNKIDRFTLETLPHSILLEGEYGCEEDDIVLYIANKFEFNTFDLTDSISKEFIDTMYDSHNITLYTVKLQNISEREQNILLKLYEEPSDYIYIIIITDNDSAALETIRTRSYELQADLYTKDQLMTLTEDALTLELCTTPGQISIANHTDMDGLYKLCNLIVDSMSKASYQNALSISNKINFTDEYDKYDLRLFIKMLRRVLLEKQNYLMYKELIIFNSHIWSMTYKQKYFENFITKIWSLER